MSVGAEVNVCIDYLCQIRETVDFAALFSAAAGAVGCVDCVGDFALVMCCVGVLSKANK